MNGLDKGIAVGLGLTILALVTGYVAYWAFVFVVEIVTLA